MSARQVNIVVDSADPAAMARFWADLLHVPVDGTHVHSPELTLTFVPAREPQTVKNRVHLDLASQSPSDQHDIVAHALSLGAAHADIGQGDTPWVVLKDPEGNEFCVLEPRPEYAAIGPVAAIVVDALTPTTQAAAWSKITGRPITRATEDLASLRGPGPWLEFVRVTEPKTHRNRLRPAVGPPDRPQVHPDQDRDLHRRGNADLQEQHDPEGNEFLVQRGALGRELLE